jgi:hypothetical protein
MSVKCSVFLAAMVAAHAFVGTAGAGVQVWFVSEGKPVAVTRTGTTVRQAVERLLEGPTAPERRRGPGTAVPRETPLRSLTVSSRIAAVDLGERATRHEDADAADTGHCVHGAHELTTRSRSDAASSLAAKRVQGLASVGELLSTAAGSRLGPVSARVPRVAATSSPSPAVGRSPWRT